MAFLSDMGRKLWINAVLLLCFTLSGALAQTQLVRITTNVLPPYSPYIQDYPGTGNRVQIFISNLSGRPLTVRMLGKLEGDNGVAIRTSPNYRPLVPLQLAATDINRLVTRAEIEGLFDLGQIDVQGMDKNLLYRGLPLPEGNYQLCMQAFDHATARPLSADFPMGCSGLIPVRIVEPPILIAPMAEAAVPANMPQTQLFTWTAPVGILPNQVEYTLRVIELPTQDIDPNVYIDAVVLPKSGIEVKNLRQTSFLYGPQHPPLQLGKRYAWRVQAHALNGRINFMNGGKSPVQWFRYGTMPIAQLPGMELVQTSVIPIPGMGGKSDSTESKKVMYAYKMPANCSCKTPPSGGDQVDNASVLKSRKATIAGFPLELLANVKEEKGVLTGTGMIPVPMINNSMIRLRVRLFDVQCNANGQVVGGFVRAIYKNGAPGYTPDYDKPDMPALEMSPATMENLSGFLNGAKDQLVSSLTNSAKSVGFELPLGIDKSFGPVNTVIAITNMTFTPEQAFFDANTWIETGTAFGVPLSGYNMCFSPQKPCGEGILYLAKKMELSPYFALKGAEEAPSSGPFAGPDTTQTTHVVFDEKGFKQLRVHGLLTPPDLIDAATKGQAEISVNAGMISFKNWTALLDFPKFYVAGLEDFKFSMKPGKPALYDHSETATPAKLPEGYLTGSDVNLWQGLYFPELDVELPSFMKRADGQKLTVGIQDMISDNNGFSGKALVKNILDIGSGSMDSWYYSIDELSLTFLHSAFKESGMNGKIVLPVFKDPNNAASQMPYTCTLSKEEQGGGMTMQFVAKPTDEMQVDIWRAKLKLTNSSINVTYSGSNGVEAKAILNGSIDIDAEYFTIPGAKFEELTLSSKTPHFNIKSLKMGFASPQKLMEDFPLTLSSADMVSDAADPMRFGFRFSGKLDLTGTGTEGLTANAGATLYFKTALKSGRPDWSFDGISPDKVSIDAPMGPVHVKGSLEFYKNDNVYGTGLAGDVKMTVKGLLGGLVKAKFGRTIAEKGGYKYWYVGGQVDIGGSGIPFAPPSPLVFRSFGGGLYSKASRKTNSQGLVYFEPDEKVNFGFEAKVGIGLVTPGVVTMEGTMGLEINTNNTIGKMSFHADAWVLGDAKSSALAKGDGDVSYDFANNIFDAQLNLSAGYHLPGIDITAETKSANLHVDGAGIWFMALGVPENRVGLTVDIANLAKFNFGSYFMLGNANLSKSSLPPAPYGFDQRPGILAELGYKNALGPVFKDGSPMIAFGSGYKMKSDFGVGPFHLRYDGAIGYDLALSKTNDLCNGQTPGINGWYAMGQIYAYAHFALDLDIDTWVYEGTFTVVELEAAAMLRGGMVNPIWLNGHVLLRYRALGGLVKGRVNLEFWYNKGQRCEPTFAPPNPFAGQPLIASLGPSGTDEAVSVLTPMYAEFNYPVESDLIIDLEVPAGQKVEAGTQGTTSQGPGGVTILHREFQLRFGKGFDMKAVKIDPEYASCLSENAGRISYGRSEEGDPNYSATFYRDAALIPNSTYDLSLDLKVFIRNNGKMEDYLFKNQTVEQKETVKFLTGPCISVLSKGTDNDDAVLTSYPFEGQRYFMKGEGAPTFIKLKSKMSCCLTNLNSDANYELKVRFTPLEGTTFADDKPGSVLTANAQFNEDQVNYELPAGMKNKTLYRFELVRIPRPDFVKNQYAEAQKAKAKAKKFDYANIYVAANKQLVATGLQPGTQNLSSGATIPNGPAVNTQYAKQTENYTIVTEAEYEKVAAGYGTTYKISAGTEKMYNDGKFAISLFNASENTTNTAAEQAKLANRLEVRVYRYYFKTSKYNTMSEKIASAQFPVTETNGWGKMVDALTTKMVAQEGFDSYELRTSFLGNGNYQMPRLLLLASAESNWYKGVAKPVADFLRIIPPSFYTDLNDKSIYNNKSNVESAFQRSMVSFNTIYDGIQKPIETSEILNLIPSERKKTGKP